MLLRYGNTSRISSFWSLQSTGLIYGGWQFYSIFFFVTFKCSFIQGICTVKIKDTAMSENSIFGDCMHDLPACDSSFNFFSVSKVYASTEVMSPSLINFFLIYQFLFFWLVFKAVEWLSELLDALLKTHIRLGDDAQETKVLLEKHRKFVDVAQVKYVGFFFFQYGFCAVSHPLLNRMSS